MAKEESKIPPESYPMNAGHGPLSYAQNSSRQKGSVDATKEMINEAIADKFDIEDLCLESFNKCQIADLGCSTGPNTFFAVQNIIEAVEHKYHSKYQKSPTLEFQVYFNDHTNNDFNILFRSLPPLRRYFATGVPGSFYGRLLLESTIHIYHSSNSLHWLSRVPEEIEDSNSLAWNKGSIYCTSTKKEVADAYSAQYRKDMEIFLNARAQELVGGGLMILLLGGVPNGVPQSQTNAGRTFDILGSCLIDMVKKGLISEEKVDSFNLPIYFPSTKELEELINKNGYFSIERMETLTPSMKHITQDIQKWALHTRAGLEGIVRNHFGNLVVEEFFEYVTKKLVQNCSIFEENNKNILLSIVLKRKKC